MKLSYKRPTVIKLVHVHLVLKNGRLDIQTAHRESYANEPDLSECSVLHAVNIMGLSALLVAEVNVCERKR